MPTAPAPTRFALARGSAGPITSTRHRGSASARTTGGAAASVALRASTLWRVGYWRGLTGPLRSLLGSQGASAPGVAGALPLESLSSSARTTTTGLPTSTAIGSAGSAQIRPASPTSPCPEGLAHGHGVRTACPGYSYRLDDSRARRRT